MVNHCFQVTKIPALDVQRAAQLVSAATEYPCRITIGNMQQQFNAKSFLALLTLDIHYGVPLVITADGPRETEACERLMSFFI